MDVCRYAQIGLLENQRASPDLICDRVERLGGDVVAIGGDVGGLGDDSGARR